MMKGKEEYVKDPAVIRKDQTSTFHPNIPVYPPYIGSLPMQSVPVYQPYLGYSYAVNANASAGGVAPFQSVQSPYYTYPVPSNPHPLGYYEHQVMYKPLAAQKTTEERPKANVTGVQRRSNPNGCALAKATLKRVTLQIHKRQDLQKTTVESEEDIAKWIEERKRRYPTLAKRESVKANGKDDFSTAQRSNCKDHKTKQKATCKYFRRGKCQNGSKCKFGHVTSTGTGAGRNFKERPQDELLKVLDASNVHVHVNELLDVLRFLRARKFRFCVSKDE